MLSPKSRNPLVDIATIRTGCGEALQPHALAAGGRATVSSGGRYDACCWAMAGWQGPAGVPSQGAEEFGAVELSVMNGKFRGVSLLLRAPDAVDIGLELVHMATRIRPPRSAHERATREVRADEICRRVREALLGG
jgi:hypothetical protein